jgi:dipeptidyl aminopeptidase/acylaminoacyl peptidase
MTSREGRAAFRAWLEPAKLIKGGRVAPIWIGANRFAFVAGGPDNTTIEVFDADAKKTSALFDVAKVRAAYKSQFGREAPGKGLPFDTLAPSPGGFSVTVEGKPFTLSADGAGFSAPPQPDMMEQVFGGAYALPEIYKRPHFWADSFPAPATLSPDGKWFASVRDHDIWLRSTLDGARVRLTFDGASLNSWDVESFRMGIAAGGQYAHYFTNPWSPTSYRLFVTRFDERGIKPWLRTRWGQASDEVEYTYMSRAGDRLPTTAPYVIDILKRSVVALDLPIEDRFLLPLGWSNDGASVFVAQISRDMSWAGVYRADAENGQAKLLFEEKVATFLRIQHDFVSGRSGCTLLPNGQGFLWESARDGWKHLHHYDSEGRHVRQLTSGKWPIVNVLHTDPVSGFVYFSAHHDEKRPYDIHICRVPLAGGKVQRLSEGKGSHDAQFAPDLSLFIDTVSCPDSPPQSTLRSASGEALHGFDAADISAWKEAGWTAPEQAVVKAADGETDLWTVVFKPRDFDASKSYPVIHHLYNGPQVAWTPHHFAAFPYRMGALSQAMTQLGYVVVFADSRGTPERSQAFQDAVYKEWRRHVTADHAAVLRNLAKDRPWIDLTRVGVWGHSWGGYYTFANLIDNPDLFRAGLCSAPGFDPYDAFIYEPYLGGAPSGENRAAYEDALLVNDAGKLQSELMIVAGSNDMSVWQGSVRMADALIRAGKDHEFVVMPAQFHGYTGAHDDYFIEKFVNFFDRTVKKAAGGSR